MAKKKNLVKRTKKNTAALFMVLIAAGWLLAVSFVLTHDARREQGAAIAVAKLYLEDKLYVRAAAGYRNALDAYHTVDNLQYEGELLSLYKDAGMWKEYYALIDDRMSAGTASAEEYRDRAQAYIDQGMFNKAIPVLQQGMASYQNEELTELYESISYIFSPASTVFAEVLMPSSDWYIPAYNGEAWGYVGTNGKTLMKFIYEEATRFSGNYAVVRKDGVYMLIDKNGYRNAIDKNDLDAVTAISGKRIVGVKDGLYRIYTNTFQALGKEAYDNIYLNDNGLTVVQKEGKWAILDESLQPVTDYCFTDVAVNSKGQVFNGGYGVAADETGYYLINREGKPYFEERFAGAKGMEDGLFAVMNDSGIWGFANEKAELVVPYRYEDACSFSNRLAAVKYAGKWGYINKYDDMVIEAQFSRAFPFLAGSALVTDELGDYKILTLKYYTLF